MRRLCLGALLMALGLICFGLSRADADHGLRRCGGTGQAACLDLTSPLVDNVIKGMGEVTWCLNPRASNYPGFRSQVAQVSADYAAKLGVPHREVSWPASRSDTSCMVRHEMPEVHGCGSGCAAWIYYKNWPVLIEYKWQLGFTSWLATIGHELGHGYCLLDEHYDKKLFVSFILRWGFWQHGEPTVMDSGTHAVVGFIPSGIWFLTVYDLDRCEETLGRDLDEEPAPACGFVGDTVTWPSGELATWNTCVNRWVGSAGNDYEPSTEDWWLYGVREWSRCTDWGGRYNYRAASYMPGLHSIFIVAGGYWSTAPGC